MDKGLPVIAGIKRFAGALVKHFLQGFLLALSLFHASASAGPVDEAQALFARDVALEHSFDPAAADLYAAASNSLSKTRSTQAAARCRLAS